MNQWIDDYCRRHDRSQDPKLGADGRAYIGLELAGRGENYGAAFAAMRRYIRRKYGRDIGELAVIPRIRCVSGACSITGGATGFDTGEPGADRLQAFFMRRWK